MPRRSTRKPTRWCEQILADLGKPRAEVIGDSRALEGIDAKRYTDEQFGLPTVQDILEELEKPGRDPRPEFKTAAFQEGVEDLKDLKPGMLLEGVVTNVTNFGAFVDIGVHQDGLVHISMMSHKFIKDPRELVKAGRRGEGQSAGGRSAAQADCLDHEVGGAAGSGRCVLQPRTAAAAGAPGAGARP